MFAPEHRNASPEPHRTRPDGVLLPHSQVILRVVNPVEQNAHCRMLPFCSEPRTRPSSYCKCRPTCFRACGVLSLRPGFFSIPSRHPALVDKDPYAQTSHHIGTWLSGRCGSCDCRCQGVPQGGCCRRCRRACRWPSRAYRRGRWLRHRASPGEGARQGGCPAFDPVT